jgi:hypothetical protein
MTQPPPKPHRESLREPEPTTPMDDVKPERPPAPPVHPFPCPMCGVGSMGDTPHNVNWLTRRTRTVLATFSLAVMAVQMDSPDIDDASFVNEAVRRFRDACEAMGLVEKNARVHSDTPRPQRKARKRVVPIDAPPDRPVPSEDDLIIEHNHPRATVCGESCPAYGKKP